MSSIPCEASFDVTFGLIIKLHKAYRVEIDIFFDDKSMIEKDRSSISADPLIARATTKNDYVSIENMKLTSVSIANLGLHRLEATLYGDTDGDGAMSKIHVAEGFFFVSDGWNK